MGRGKRNNNNNNNNNSKNRKGQRRANEKKVRKTASGTAAAGSAESHFRVEESGERVVDGGALEGGGQILRNSVSVSAILGLPLRIERIRANRPRGGGLRPQHLTGIELVAQMYRAKLEGGKVGSSEVRFRPHRMDSNLHNVTADTRTAGSICLLAQVALPCALFASNAVQFTLRGGTNAIKAPPIDYLDLVLLPLLRERMGITAQLKIARRGFYPKGGGEVLLSCQPVAPHIRSIVLEERGEIEEVKLHAFYTSDWADAWQEADVEARLKERCATAFPGAACSVTLEAVKSARDSASGLTLLALSSTGCRYGYSELSEGKRRRSVSSMVDAACDGIIHNAGNPWNTVDEYMQDQLLIFMALASGTSVVRCGPLTLHTKTSVFFLSKLTGAKFTVTRVDEKSGERTEVDMHDGIDYEGKHRSSRFEIRCKGVAWKTQSDDE